MVFFILRKYHSYKYFFYFFYMTGMTGQARFIGNKFFFIFFYFFFLKLGWVPSYFFLVFYFFNMYNKNKYKTYNKKKKTL